MKNRRYVMARRLGVVAVVAAALVATATPPLGVAATSVPEPAPPTSPPPESVGAIVELHEETFDARPELTNLVVGEGMAAVEAVFVGTQMEEFAGIPASGQQVAVPYAVFYDLADGKITALRIHGFATGLVAALTAGATPTSTAP